MTLEKSVGQLNQYNGFEITDLHLKRDRRQKNMMILKKVGRLYAER
jgi:hypothetical protein